MRRISELLAAALERALGSMTAREFSISPCEAAETDEALIWQQSLSIASGPVLWIAAGRDIWMEAGRMTLSAVGIDDPSEDDSRSTWQEIVGQAVGGFASALTAEVAQEVTAVSGEEIAAMPEGVEWAGLEIRCGESVWMARCGWLKALADLFVSPGAEVSVKSPGSRDSNFSKTFDLLLDVALPVAVSFGKTSLQIREVLKLNTGSIVELNRFVAEPVDVIVNDCVIARGEVVVVDGNYGVRITQLASREDRLRSGMAEAPARVAAPLR